MHFFRLRLLAALLAGITVISVASTYFDVLAHKHSLRVDLARRVQWFGAGVQPLLEQQLAAGAPNKLPRELQRLRQYPDQPSLAVYDTQGTLLASTGDVSALHNFPAELLKAPLNHGKESGVFTKAGGNALPSGRVEPTRYWYEYAIPLHDGQRTVGALVMVSDADYIRHESMGAWKRSFLRIAAMVLVVVLVTLFMVRWFFFQPLTRAVEWLRRVRRGDADIRDGAAEFGLLMPLANEVTTLAENLTRARAAAEAEARLRDAAEHVWTADRLGVHVRERLGSGKLYVVSNREPYMHVRKGNEVACVVPPSGLVSAIEPVLHACDGTWIAHGSGNEDAAFVDANDRLRVPPDEPRYTLRRVWLSEEEVAGYYEGFANEGLWPLCHIAHTRPIFRASDWAYYQRVNAKFAEIL
ncbi:MAG TPA: trehalose-6-phosphate synthase, partial [Acidobacteriaceae bacterium]